MTRKIIILLLALGLLIGAAVIPLGKATGPAVVHQHESWPGESNQTTGLDANGTLSSHLPLVIIKSNGGVIPGITRADSGELICDYSIVHNKTGVNRSDDPPSQSGRMAIFIRGNSSREFPKKQYGIRLVDEKGESQAAPVLDMPADTTWTLNGSYIDHSLIRNYMLYNISGEIMGYAPRCRLCEVMITDRNGKPQYEGVYTLTEKVKVSEQRLDLTRYDPSYIETSFMLQSTSHIDNLEIRHLKSDQAISHKFDLEYPDLLTLTKPSLEYINHEVIKFEKKLFDAEHTGDWDQVNQEIDMDSFIDFYLINEFFQNYDAGRLSTYVYKNLGGKFHIGPVWDFDGTFNNFIGIDIELKQLKLRKQFYYYYLAQDPEFSARCQERYQELRHTYLSEEYLLHYIERSGEYLAAPAKRNCNRWYNGDLSGYTRDLQKMKDYVIQRGAWMDENFERLSTVVEWKGTS